MVVAAQQLVVEQLVVVRLGPTSLPDHLSHMEHHLAMAHHPLHTTQAVEDTVELAVATLHMVLVRAVLAQPVRVKAVPVQLVQHQLVLDMDTHLLTRLKVDTWGVPIGAAAGVVGLDSEQRLDDIFSSDVWSLEGWARCPSRY